MYDEVEKIKKAHAEIKRAYDVIRKANEESAKAFGYNLAAALIIGAALLIMFIR